LKNYNFRSNFLKKCGYGFVTLLSTQNAPNFPSLETNVDSETIEKLLRQQFEINPENATKAALNINDAHGMKIVKERTARYYFQKFRGGLPAERKKASRSQTTQTKASM
jgi:hypothetical protein